MTTISNFLKNYFTLTTVYTHLFSQIRSGFSSHLRIFHSNGEVTITGGGLRILVLEHVIPTRTRKVAVYTYMVIFEDPRHLHLLPSDQQWTCHRLFLQLRYSNIQVKPSACESYALTDCATAATSLLDAKRFEDICDLSPQKYVSLGQGPMTFTNFTTCTD